MPSRIRVTSPYLVSSLVLPTLSACTFHTNQKGWNSPYPNIGAIDADVQLEALLDRDVAAGYGSDIGEVSLSDSSWQDLGNDTSMFATGLPRCRSAKHLDEGSGLSYRRSGVFFKVGVVSFCLCVLSGLVLMELMSDDSIDSKSHMDMSTSVGSKASAPQSTPTKLSTRFPMHPERSFALEQGEHAHALPTPHFPKSASVVESCASDITSHNDLINCDEPQVNILRAPPKTQSERGSTHTGGVSLSSQGGSDQVKPPWISSGLVSSAESHYTVGLKSLDTAAGPVPIHDRGNRCLFTAHIQKIGLRTRAVILTKRDAPDILLGSITSAAGRRMIVHDSYKRPFATLTSVGHLAYSLTWCGVERMKLRTDSRTGQVLLVNSYNGEHLASGTKLSVTSGLPSPEDHLGISVVAGMDPSLVILCFIGAMALPS